MTLAVVIAAAFSLVAAGPPESNQTLLTKRESQRLVDWSSALRTCLTRRGLEVGRPEVTRRQITLALTGAGSSPAVAVATIRCGDSLGGPPTDSSLQSFPGRIVLYVPKQCLIDRDVVRRAA
jgi:hypothetical protein